MKIRVILVVWINRLVVSLTVLSFLIGFFKGFFVYDEYNMAGTEYLVYGMMMLLVLGAFQLIIAMTSSVYFDDIMGENKKILEKYTKAVMLYILILLIGSALLYALKSYDYFLYSDLGLEDFLFPFYILFCPVMIATYFTLYLEMLKKESKKNLKTIFQLFLKV